MRKKSNFLQFFMMLIVGSILGSVGFIFLSPQFEQTKPYISIDDSIYWNLRNKINLEIHDESGIKSYKVTFVYGSSKIILAQDSFTDNKDKKLVIKLDPPKYDMFFNKDNTSIEIEVTDNSRWNFLEGNKAVKVVKVTVDTRLPVANVIANSRKIMRGGSAAVIVKVADENLKDAYIIFNNKQKFELIPYYKEGYFTAIIAWDMKFDKFHRVDLVATDKAGNKTYTKVPLYIYPKKVKNKKIKISPHFVSNVSNHVLEQSGEDVPVSEVDRFLAHNDKLRKKNIDRLYEVARKRSDMSFVNDFTLNTFKRLRGSVKAAGYGEKRSYYYKKHKIDEQFHLGIDWASTKKARISASNDGKVILDGYLGIYGNTIIIDHGYGISALYAHMSSVAGFTDNIVRSGDRIGNTGTTGAVLGDHLHFGLLVQGIEVNPVEWMDRKWIKTNIKDIYKKSKKIIEKQL